MRGKAQGERLLSGRTVTIGVDGSFDWEMLNFGAMVMKGSDDKKMNILDSTENYDYTGGFVEVNWTGLFSNRLVTTLMHNWVLPPSYDSQGFHISQRVSRESSVTANSLERLESREEGALNRALP